MTLEMPNFVVDLIPLHARCFRLELFRISMKNIEMSESINLDVLADKTEGYSGADIANVCRDAAMMVSD